MMTDIPLRNSEFLEMLENCRKLLTDDVEGFQKNLGYHCESELDDTEGQREKWTSEDYLKYVVEVEGDKHEGFPDHLVGYGFKPHQPDQNVKLFKPGHDPVWTNEFITKLYAHNTDLVNFLGAKNNALFCYYPPGGYISWHNNWNASAYNLICSWSETGDGWFKYLDPKTREIVTIPDESGWQIKAGYFGGQHEKDRVCYHAASTDCWRLTVSFIWNHMENSQNLQDDLLYEISSE